MKNKLRIAPQELGRTTSSVSGSSVLKKRTPVALLAETNDFEEIKINENCYQHSCHMNYLGMPDKVTMFIVRTIYRNQVKFLFLIKYERFCLGFLFGGVFSSQGDQKDKVSKH